MLAVYIFHRNWELLKREKIKIQYEYFEENSLQETECVKIQKIVNVCSQERKAENRDRVKH